MNEQFVKIGGMSVIQMDPNAPGPGVSDATCRWLTAQGQLLDVLDEAHTLPMLANVILPLFVGWIFSRVGQEETARLLALMPEILSSGLVEMQAQNMGMN